MNAVRYRYPDTLSHFYLAEMLRKNGEYAAAIPYYENYLAYAQTLPTGKSDSPLVVWRRNGKRSLPGIL